MVSPGHRSNGCNGRISGGVAA